MALALSGASAPCTGLDQFGHDGVAAATPSGAARALALTSIALWVAAIAAGRFMAYI